MISADHVLIDGDTVWVLSANGLATHLWGGTGHHVFDIEVDTPKEVPERPKMEHLFTRTLRVYVERILPIHDKCPEYKPADHICQAYRDERWIHHRSENPEWTEGLITLPPAARPGMWLVECRTVPENVEEPTVTDRTVRGGA